MDGLCDAAGSAARGPEAGPRAGAEHDTLPRLPMEDLAEGGHVAREPLTVAGHDDVEDRDACGTDVVEGEGHHDRGVQRPGVAAAEVPADVGRGFSNGGDLVPPTPVGGTR